MVGCAGAPPLEEYTLARTAIESAQSIGANRYAPGFWFKSEESYRQGELKFKQGKFDEAQVFFTQAREFAEKAENKARYDKLKSDGEDLR